MFEVFSRTDVLLLVGRIGNEIGRLAVEYLTEFVEMFNTDSYSFIVLIVRNSLRSYSREIYEFLLSHFVMEQTLQFDIELNHKIPPLWKINNKTMPNLDMFLSNFD